MSSVPHSPTNTQNRGGRCNNAGLIIELNHLCRLTMTQSTVPLGKNEALSVFTLTIETQLVESTEQD